MKKLNTQELRERIKTLPPDLTDAVFSPDIAEILLSIGKKYGLMIDKVGELSSATNHVILGALHPRDFIPTLEDVLKIDRETAQKIAQEVNTEIFAKIRESLRKVHDIREQPIVIRDTNIPKPPIPPISPVKPPSPTPSSTTPIPSVSPAPPVFGTDKKILFADLKSLDVARDKPEAPTIQQPLAVKPPAAAQPSAPETATPLIRPFQGGVKVEVKKEPQAPVEKIDGDLEKEIEGLLKAAVESKPKEAPKKFWPTPEIRQPVADIKLGEPPKPLVDVKIKAVEDEPALPKMSPFGAKMQDGIFRSGPAEERKITEEKPSDSARDKPAVPKYGFSDPYREAPDEKERGSLPRAA